MTFHVLLPPFHDDLYATAQPQTIVSVVEISFTKHLSRFGWVVGSFPLKAKWVTYVILVFLVEPTVRHLAERLAPKYERLFDWQPKDLKWFDP